MFPTYEKIAESADAWRLEPAAWRDIKRANWVVTEKIHGANFCFIADGNSLTCANRKAMLTDGDSFFGYQAVRDLLGERIRELAARVRERYPQAARCLVYGELFGGGYPHPDVPTVAGVQPVQTGVWYAPDIRFCAFDIRIEATEGSSRFLDYEAAIDWFAKADLFFAAPLLIGKYEEATVYPLEFDSTIPARLGLAPLPLGTNRVEGIVVKPYREILLPTPNGPVRPVLKRKRAEFAEDRRYHEAEKWQDAPAHASALDMLKWEAYCRLTENRWAAAVSKVGRERRAEAFALLVDEVLAEAMAGRPDAARRWQAELSAYIREEAARLLPIEG